MNKQLQKLIESGISYQTPTETRIGWDRGSNSKISVHIQDNLQQGFKTQVKGFDSNDIKLPISLMTGMPTATSSTPIVNISFLQRHWKNAIAPTCAKDDLRRYLNALYISKSNMAVTDGARIIKIDIESPEVGEDNILVNRDILDFVFSKFKNVVSATWHVSTEPARAWLEFKLADYEHTILVSSTDDIQGRFPDFSRIFTPLETSTALKSIKVNLDLSFAVEYAKRAPTTAKRKVPIIDFIAETKEVKCQNEHVIPGVVVSEIGETIHVSSDYFKDFAKLKIEKDGSLEFFVCDGRIYYTTHIEGHRVSYVLMGRRP